MTMTYDGERACAVALGGFRERPQAHVIEDFCSKLTPPRTSSLGSLVALGEDVLRAGGALKAFHGSTSHAVALKWL